MPLDVVGAGAAGGDRFFFPAVPRDPKARTRRSVIGDEINATTHETPRPYTASAMLSDSMDLSPFVH